MNVKNFKVFVSLMLICAFFMMSGCAIKEYEMPDTTGYNYNDGLVALNYDTDHFEVNDWFAFDDNIFLSGVMEKAEKYVISASQIELLHITGVNYTSETLEVGVYDVFDDYLGNTKDYDFRDSFVEDVPGCNIYSVKMVSDEDTVNLKAWLHNDALTVAAMRIPKSETLLEIHEYDSELEDIFSSMLYLGDSIKPDYFMSFDDEGNLELHDK